VGLPTHTSAHAHKDESSRFIKIGLHLDDAEHQTFGEKFMKKQLFSAFGLALALSFASPAWAQAPAGTDNISTIEQLDNSNAALVAQHAEGGINDSDVYQDSTNSRAWVVQEGGANNLSSVTQYGDNQKAAVYQKGTGTNTSLLIQGGDFAGGIFPGSNSNQAYVGQGDVMTGVDPNGQSVAGVTFPTVSMAGTPTSANSYSEVTQTGSGNLAIVNQY
jgi:hypothetical protein